jgi:hypothetical protein
MIFSRGMTGRLQMSLLTRKFLFAPTGNEITQCFLVKAITQGAADKETTLS